MSTGDESACECSFVSWWVVFPSLLFHLDVQRNFSADIFAVMEKWCFTL